jgi:Tfp pilus assembly protein PilV
MRIRPRRRRAGMRRLARRRAGFALVELLFAIVMLTVGTLAMAGVLAASLRLQRLSATRNEMTSLAEAKLEELRSYASPTSTPALKANLALGGSLTSIVASYADSVTLVTGARYYRRWQISTGVAGTRQITVRVLPKADVAYQVKRLDFTTFVQM